MCTVHHHHMCTDVYLQGSSVGNEKITGSCLPADVKAVSPAFSCAAITLVCYPAVSIVTQWGGALRDHTKNGCVADYFHAGASTMEEGKLFLSVTVLYCHDYLFF